MTEPDAGRPLPVTVFGYDEVVQVLRDNETYSSTVYEGVMGAVMGRTILQMDEPDHRLHRALVSPTFRSKILQRWEEDLVRTVVDELIDGFADQGHADLVQEVTFNFPVQVIARILGLPRSDFPMFQRWAIEITSVTANWDRGRGRLRGAARLLRRGAGRAAAPTRPTTSSASWSRSRSTASRLDDEEIYSFLRLLLRPGSRPPTAPRAACSTAC